MESKTVTLSNVYNFAMATKTQMSICLTFSLNQTQSGIKVYMKPVLTHHFLRKMPVQRQFFLLVPLIDSVRCLPAFMNFPLFEFALWFGIFVIFL